MNKPEVLAEFTTCPNCGSTDKLSTLLIKDAKERGQAGDDFKAPLMLIKGVIQDPQHIAKIPIGGSIPAFVAEMDFCLQCGTLYATRIVKLEATKGVPAPPPQAPGLFRGN